MIEVKKINDIEDFKKIPEIQKSAWGFDDWDIEPHHLMTRVQKYGGLVQGLYYSGNLAGFTYALIGRWKGKHFIYSHMTGVLQEHQKQGFGYLLKKAQREEVLKALFEFCFKIKRMPIIKEMDWMLLKNGLDKKCQKK